MTQSHYTYLVSQLKEKYPDIVGPDLPFAVPSTDPNVSFLTKSISRR